MANLYASAMGSEYGEESGMARPSSSTKGTEAAWINSAGCPTFSSEKEALRTHHASEWARHALGLLPRLQWESTDPLEGKNVSEPDVFFRGATDCVEGKRPIPRV